MKTYLLLLLFLTTNIIGIKSQLLVWDDFESYDQGSISNQNGAWVTLSNATANVTWNGGSDMACSGLDVNEAFLAYSSGDNISTNTLVGSSALQMNLTLKVFQQNGFYISLTGNDFTFLQYNSTAQEQFIVYRFFIDFHNHLYQIFANDTEITSATIPDFVNTIEGILLDNNSGNFKLACLALEDITDLDSDGFTAAGGDCNDLNPDVNPGASEVPYDGVDNDCNPATIDDDIDQDGFILANDCNDNDATINPNQIEISYNGKDDDCNPLTLDDDLDADGYVLALDCNDNNANVNPGESEITYNGIDDDCNPNTRDNDIDDDNSDYPDDCNDNNPDINPNVDEIPYNDIDDDCNPNTIDNDIDDDNSDYPDDCDDNNPDINPNVDEIPYNGIDDDCNPNTRDNDIDDDNSDYPDDCDDNNPDINPNAEEILDNDIDENCDGILGTTSTKNETNSSFSIYPNPARDLISINLDVEIKSISIFNELNQEIIESKDFTVDISKLNSGLYLCRIITNDDTIIVSKFIKM